MKDMTVLDAIKQIHEQYGAIPVIVRKIIHDDARYPVYETHILSTAGEEEVPGYVMPYPDYFCPMLTYDVFDLQDDAILSALGLKATGKVAVVVSVSGPDKPMGANLTRQDVEENYSLAAEKAKGSGDEDVYMEGYREACRDMLGVTGDWDGHITDWGTFDGYQKAHIAEVKSLKDLDALWSCYNAGIKVY